MKLSVISHLFKPGGGWMHPLHPPLCPCLGWSCHDINENQVILDGIGLLKDQAGFNWQVQNNLNTEGIQTYSVQNAFYSGV